MSRPVPVSHTNSPTGCPGCTWAITMARYGCACPLGEMCHGTLVEAEPAPAPAPPSYSPSSAYADKSRAALARDGERMPALEPGWAMRPAAELAQDRARGARIIDGLRDRFHNHAFGELCAYIDAFHDLTDHLHVPFPLADMAATCRDLDAEIDRAARPPYVTRENLLAVVLTPSAFVAFAKQNLPSDYALEVVNERYIRVSWAK